MKKKRRSDLIDDIASSVDDIKRKLSGIARQSSDSDDSDFEERSKSASTSAAAKSKSALLPFTPSPAA